MSGRALAGVEALGRAIGARRADARRQVIVRTVEADFAGVAASVEGESILLEGRGLLRRWMSDLRLRDVGRGER